MTLPFFPPRLRTGLVGCLVGALGFWAQAQTAALPLKNLQIEVRQVRTDSVQEQGISVTDPMPLRSNSRSTEARSLQHSLVLNGRAVRLLHGSSTPLRLQQSYLRNGVIVVLPTTVWVQAASGFMATPRWNGEGFVELEIHAQQASTPQGQPPGALAQDSTSTQVLVPLNDWTTIAHSDAAQDTRRSDLGQWGTRQQEGSTVLQVRISVP